MVRERRTFSSNSAIIELAASRLSAFAAITEVNAVLLGVGRQGRVRVVDQVLDDLGHVRLADPDRLERPRHQHPAAAHPEARRDLLLPHLLHLVGDAGMQAIFLPFVSTHQPGAVPIGLSIARKRTGSASPA